MSEHNTEVWADMARVSRRIVNLEQRMLERLLALEAEVAALKGQRNPQQSGDQPVYETGTLPQYEQRAEGATQDGRTIYEDVRKINWRSPDAAYSAIARIIQRGDV
jgi:hypothetical protein